MLVCEHSRPSDGILCLFLNQSYALQNISDVIDTSLLLYIQFVSRLSYGIIYGIVLSCWCDPDKGLHLVRYILLSLTIEA